MKRRIKDTPISINEYSNEFSYIYKRQIDWFFGERKEESVYIQDKDTSNTICQYLFDTQSNIIYLVGKSGIGKTTLIKNEFGLSDNAIIYNNEQGIIYASISFRGQLSANDMNEYIANSISGICSSLEEKFEFARMFYTVEGHLEFYDYILETIKAILENIQTTELIGKSAEEAKIIKLSKAEKYNHIQYEASRLKFYLSKYCKSYKKIVLIVDNIETFPSDIRLLIIRNMLSLFSCLLNVPEKKNSMPIDLVVSLCERTFIRMSKVEEIVAYNPKVVIRQKNPIDIFLYLDKKYNESEVEQGDIMLWKDFYEILMNFSKKFDNKYSTMIKNLSNYDFQAIKSTYKKILTNKVWILRGERKKDFLNLSLTESLFNNISVIRAMACGNNAVYRGTKSKMVPNILLNDEVNDDSIICLLVLSYLIKNEIQIKRKRISSIFNEIFKSSEVMASLDRVLDYYLECGVLEEIVDTDFIDSEKYIEVTPRGKELWVMLVSDSVLLEMYREDFYLNDENEKLNFASSYDLMSSIGQYEIFNQLFYYIAVLLDTELEYHKIVIANKKLTEFYNCFGRKLQTKRLLEGVMRSVEYSGNTNAPGIQSGIKMLKDQMRDMETSK